MRWPPVELEAALLKRGGNRWGKEIQFLCPSHDDHNPSASYNVEKHVWNCHGCSARGGWMDLCKKLGLEVPPHQPNSGRFEASYPYHDAANNLIFEVVRKQEPKGFFQRQPNGSGGWISNLNGVKRVLYRLPQLLAAVREGREIFLPEGEKDVDNLVALGLEATTSPGGAGRWHAAYAHALQGARVVLLPDNDDPGRQHVQKVARSLADQAHEIRVLELPGLASKGDVSDWIEERESAGSSQEDIGLELQSLAAAAPLWAPGADDPGLGAASGRAAETSGEEEIPQVELLSSFVRETEAFLAADDTPFVTATVGDHFETWPVRSRAFKHWLVQRFYRERGKPPNGSTLQQAVDLAAACARHDGARYEVFFRVGRAPGAVFLDLGNDSWEAVEITAKGWTIVANPPVRFRRSGSMLPLPHPARGGSLPELRQFVNAGDENSLALMVSWLIGALRPAGPYPLLILQGEQGSAKSTAARMLRALIDPSEAPLRAQPRSEQDLLIGAKHSWILAFDNLSDLKPWFSDALCRLATGGGFSTRKLFTDSDEVVFHAQRPVLLTSIDDLAERQDLADRAIVLNLPSIPGHARQTESHLWEAFEEARPQILGALFDAVAGALGGISQITLETPPRMADFSFWIAAAEKAAGWPQGSFLKAYESNREEAVGRALEDDAVALAVVRFAAERESWDGTATELLALLEDFAEAEVSRTRSWPKDPKALSSRLRRASAFLRQGRVEVDFYREPGSNSRRLISLRCLSSNSVANVASVALADSEPLKAGDTDLRSSDAAPNPASQVKDCASLPTPALADVCDASDASDAEELLPKETLEPGEELVL